MVEWLRRDKHFHRSDVSYNGIDESCDSKESVTLGIVQ